MEKHPYIYITDTIETPEDKKNLDYLAHALCISGHCSFSFNGGNFEMSPGDLLIVRKSNLIENVKSSPDFKVINVMATFSFIELCAPDTNYRMKGQLSLFINPVIKLNEEQQKICLKDFEWIEYRLSQSSNKFYDELIENAMQGAILDFFDFLATKYEKVDISDGLAQLMTKFLALLDNKDFRKSREVSYYADALCVTPKYLSEVCKKVTGFPANFWINRYTIADIAHLLKEKNLSYVQISDIFHFSSPAYFTRYVQRYLGVNPSEFHMKNIN